MNKKEDVGQFERVDTPEFAVFAKVRAQAKDDLGSYKKELSAEPVYAYRRKGLDYFCTCDLDRYEELANKPNLFEVTAFFTHSPDSQAEITRLTKELATAVDALTPKPIPANYVPQAYLLEETERFAKFWENGARAEPDRGTALICLHSSVNGWKNAAYSKAEEVFKLQEENEKLTQRVEELDSQAKFASAIKNKREAENYGLHREVTKLTAALELADKALITTQKRLVQYSNESVDTFVGKALAAIREALKGEGK